MVHTPELAEIYRDALRICRPFVVAPRGHWEHLDLAPFGIKIPKTLRIDPTVLASQRFLTWIERLDAQTFGPQAMAMERWVFYDCAEWPSALFGLAVRPRDVSPTLRERFEVAPQEKVWVPLSLHVAIPTVAPGEFFEHNVGSLGKEAGLKGLGTFTKALGCRVLRAKTLVGAAQWNGRALTMHRRFGPLELLTAFTPAHSYPRTLTYRHGTDAALLGRVLEDGEAPSVESTQLVKVDERGLIGLQRRIERGARCTLAGPLVERARGLFAPIRVET
ncbi:MAG: hypothetical protein IPF99_11760 [Deltaproteobacteria bacterium]|jgi:hypothetical protein|nr:hypothetical protein [Deltaproteobacteria bacterium]